MKISARELVLALITGIVALAALSYWMVQPRLDAWRELFAYQTALRQQIQHAERLIEQSGTWQQRMDQLRDSVATYPASRDLSADYLRRLEEIARASNLTLVQRRAQPEKRFGDLYELVIDCSWEGDLEALVRFVYNLEKDSYTMDMEELNISLVAGAKGRMKGNFSVLCIYARETVPAGAE